MIDTAELGRKMMRYAPKLDDDSEFNQWCRLAPKLIGMGTATHPKDLNALDALEQALVKRAVVLLTADGNINS